MNQSLDQITGELAEVLAVNTPSAEGVDQWRHFCKQIGAVGKGMTDMIDPALQTIETLVGLLENAKTALQTVREETRIRVINVQNTPQGPLVLKSRDAIANLIPLFGAQLEEIWSKTRVFILKRKDQLLNDPAKASTLCEVMFYLEEASQWGLDEADDWAVSLNVELDPDGKPLFSYSPQFEKALTSINKRLIGKVRSVFTEFEESILAAVEGAKA